MATLVLVLGATGDQGGSVARALLAANFKVRTMTRDATSIKAKELASAGVEVVQGSSESSENVIAAAEGAYAAFIVSHRPGDELETSIAKSVISACKTAGIKHLVWSTASDAEEVTQGKLDVKHYTSKAKVDDHVRSLGFQFHTFVCPPIYYSAILKLFSRAVEGGVTQFVLPIRPSTTLTAFDVNDLGIAVRGALLDPHSWGNGEYIRFAPTDVAYSSYVEMFSTVTGKPATIQAVSAKEYMAKLMAVPAPLRESAVNSFKMYDDFGYYPKNVAKNNAEMLVPSLTTWQQWLSRLE